MEDCLRIEISDCPWTEKICFRVRIGDLSGKVNASNLTIEEVLELIEHEIKLNWKVKK